MGRAISFVHTDNNTTQRKGERVREGRTEVSVSKKKKKNEHFPSSLVQKEKPDISISSARWS